MSNLNKKQTISRHDLFVAAILTNLGNEAWDMSSYKWEHFLGSAIHGADLLIAKLDARERAASSQDPAQKDH